MSEFHIESSELKLLTQVMEDSYFTFERIGHINGISLPSRSEIHTLTQGLFGLVFPGFFGRRDISRGNVAQHLEEQLQVLGDLLHREIHACCSCRKQESGENVIDQAREATGKFLAALPGLRELLASDVLAVYQGDPAAQDTDEVVISYPAVIAIATYRLAHQLLELEVPLMPRIMTEHAHSLTGIDIHPGTRIGNGFFIDHGTGVVIGETAIIGDNCKLYQGVTLGALSFPHDETGQIRRNYKRHPTLEDDVVVYSNASILGDVTIGKGATVGGNVFLTRSVPAGCTVSSKPFELRYKNRTDGNDRAKKGDYNI